MDSKRFNEILGILMEKDNSIETADLLNELKNGYADTQQHQQRITELENSYKTLEQKYIDTFKSSLTDNTSTSTTQTQTQTEQTVEVIQTATFDDIFSKSE